MKCKKYTRKIAVKIALGTTTKMALLAIVTTMLPACGSYKNKFSGYKDSDYSNITEAKQLVIPSNIGSNPKPFATTYNIPNTPNLHNTQNYAANSEAKNSKQQTADLTLPPNFN